jgi:hypothetical protein
MEEFQNVNFEKPGVLKVAHDFKIFQDLGDWTFYSRGNILGLPTK